jgi:molybdenum cofactor synthesis domain-containing protein
MALVRLKGFQKLTAVDDALKLFLEAIKVKKLKSSVVGLNSALNRVLAEDVIASENLPGFDRSAVDGYAVRAEDVVGASQTKPKILRIVNRDRIMKGCAKRLWTGIAVPLGADSVVMLEDTRETDGSVEVWSAIGPGGNVSAMGEDVRKGDVAVEGGTLLRAQHLGLLAALGVESVSVTEKPKVAVVATGNELVEVGGKRGKGQIFESNRLVLSSLCADCGAVAVDLGLVGDDVTEIRRKIESGADSADLVLTSGGTSVGVSDRVPDVVRGMGDPGVVVHGVAMRPGMPTALGLVCGKPIVVLPGNPVAAVIGFEVFAKPVIYELLGRRIGSECAVKAKMCRRVATTLGRRSFVRVHVFERKSEFFAEPVSARGSGLISTLTRSNGFVIVLENREGVEKGEVVLVKLFDGVELED